MNTRNISPALTRRALVAAAGLTALSPAAFAQDKVIRVVLPFPAGGITDVIARMVANSVAGTLKRNVIVDNKPGAAGLIGTRAVQLAPPDGATLLVHYIGLVGLPLTQKGANYDPVRDFAPVAMVTDGPAYIVVNSGVPAKTLGEFIAWAKTVPNGIESATSGPGGGSHMWTLLLAKNAGINLLPVPYKGGSEQSMALITGEAKVLISNMSEAINAQVKAGKLRILAVCSDASSPITPGVPMAKDTVPGFVIAGWIGVFAPAGTPAAEVAQTSAAVRKAVEDPVFRDKCAAMYVEAKYQGPAEFARTMVKTSEFWHMVVSELNITPQ